MTVQFKYLQTRLTDTQFNQHKPTQENQDRVDNTITMAKKMDILRIDPFYIDVKGFLLPFSDC